MESETFDKIVELVGEGNYKISTHALGELIEDELTADDVVNNIGDAELLEDYPDFPKGRSILLMHAREGDVPVHTVWGIPKGHDSPAVLITAYVPDPARWSEDFRERRS